MKITQNQQNNGPLAGLQNTTLGKQMKKMQKEQGLFGGVFNGFSIDQIGQMEEDLKALQNIKR